MLAHDSGESLNSSYHIRASASLAFIAANPNDFSLVAPSQWPTAVPALPWTAITMQNYTGSTMSAEEAAFVQIAASAPGGSGLFLYEAWPSTADFGTSYQTYWAQTVANLDAQTFVAARQWTDHMHARLSARFPGRVFVIPIGDVYNEIDVQARAGNLPGLATVADIYRDALHAGAVGRFVAASTVFATLYGRRSTVTPTSLAYFDQGTGSGELDMALAATLEQLIMDVVSADPRTP